MKVTNESPSPLTAMQDAWVAEQFLIINAAIKAAVVGYTWKVDQIAKRVPLADRFRLKYPDAVGTEHVVRPIGCSFGYSKEEIEHCILTRQPLDLAKPGAAIRAMLEYLDKHAGDTLPQVEQHRCHSIDFPISDVDTWIWPPYWTSWELVAHLVVYTPGLVAGAER